MPSRPADEAAQQAHGAPDATAPTPTRPNYPCLEGIRALAASLVVVHHAVNYSVFLSGPGGSGWLATPAAVMDSGVAVFFVLSGFLIYRPFTAAHQSGRPVQATRSFWWRRIVRIVPAYWLALSVLWAAGVFSLGGDWWRYYLFIQVYDVFTTLGGIIPAWSLNTEMAFYLFIPFWSFVLRRVVHRNRPARPAIELLAVAVLGLSGYLSRALISSSDRVWAQLPGSAPVTMREVSFSWFPNNVDLFAAGMGLAVLTVWSSSDLTLRRRLDRLAQHDSLWGIAAVAIFLWFAYRVGPPALNGGYQGFYWQQRQLVLTAIGCCLLFPAVFGDQNRGVVRSLFRWGPVAWVGTVSYGFYLWHKDLLEQIPSLLNRSVADTPVVLLVAGAFGLGLAAAALSWYLIERPAQVWARRLL